VCQYQSQRISINIKFRALSDSWQISFAVIISVISDSMMNDLFIHMNSSLMYRLEIVNLNLMPIYFVQLDLKIQQKTTQYILTFMKKFP
jgi:hypothetical protein